MANPLHTRLTQLATRLITSHGRLVGLAEVSRSGKPWMPSEELGDQVQVRAVSDKDLLTGGGKSSTLEANGVAPTAQQLVFYISGDCPATPKKGMRLLDGVIPVAPPPPILIGITSPRDGDYLGTAAKSFVWTPGDQPVTLWELVVGTSLNANDIHSSGALDGAILTAAVVGLPTDGSTVYARLGKKIGDAVTYQWYTFLAGVDPNPSTGGSEQMYFVLDVETVKPGEIPILHKLLVER